jgi:hypothetical protein
MIFDAARPDSPRQCSGRRCLALREAGATGKRSAGASRLTGVLRVALVGLVSGCAGHHAPNTEAIQANFKGAATQKLTSPAYDPDVIAVCDPPLDWRPDPLKHSDQHTHQVWVSPTGATAYGVIHFKLPLPVGPDIALNGFLKQMKKTSGAANLISKEDDSNLGGIRFVADGGLYRIRANFLVDGWEGWAVYAGTVIKKPVNADELDTAIRAREHTYIGQPQSPGK